MFAARNTLLTRPSGSAPPSGVMIDAVSAGSYTKGAAGTPKSTTHTIDVDGSHPNRILLACFTTSSGAAVSPSEANVQVTSDLDGALTQVASSQQAIPTNLGSVQWRYVLAPDDGVHTVVGNYNGGGWVNGVGMVLISLYGVDQTTPFGTPVKTTGNNQAVNNAVTADVGDLILWALAHSVTLSSLPHTQQVVNLGSAESGYGDYTSLLSAAGTGSAATLTSSNNSVYACCGLPVLAA